MPLVELSRARVERESRRAEENQALGRADLRRWFRYVAAGAAVIAGGLAIAFASFAVTDPELGNILLLGGVTFGNVGILLLLMIYHWNNDEF